MHMRRYRPTPSRLPARVSPSTSFVVTRQDADVFNQPLSFDTSSVTDMSHMFGVRSAHALSPIPSRALACTLHAPPPPHTLPPLSPHAARFVSFAFRLGRARTRSISR